MNQSVVTFNPGPSQLSADTLLGIQELASSGFLSVSHRSKAFSEVSRQAIEGMRKQMGIPPDYRIFYQPSATAAMDTLLRNLVRQRSFHFVHGSFAGVFYKTALGIGLDSLSFDSALNLPVSWDQAVIPPEIELIAVTHNETSTGLMWPQEEMHKLRTAYPEMLLAIDVTSSFGSMKMHWREADIWFGSVQKCLGLPSGLGFIIVSPRAFEKSKTAKGVAPWQSFVQMDEKMEVYQTPETPNMLNIALLARQMSHWNLPEIEARQQEKARMLYEANAGWTPYVVSDTWRSSTVCCFVVDDPAALHQQAKKSDMVLGNGYGPLKETTIRIANFPAITRDAIQRLLKLVENA